MSLADAGSRSRDGFEIPSPGRRSLGQDPVRPHDEIREGLDRRETRVLPIQVVLADPTGPRARSSNVNGNLPGDRLLERLAERGHPTGTIESATSSRITFTPSPSRKICTSCQSSANPFPCRNGKLALVGSSEPQALFNRIRAISAKSTSPFVIVSDR